MRRRIGTLDSCLLFPCLVAKHMDAQVEVAGQMAEVSGWDMDENFFVEKAVLQPHGNGNRVDLRAQLRVGSLLFVRLFEVTSLNRTVPMAYRVTCIGRSTEMGARAVEMIELRPREMAPRILMQFTFREELLN